VSGNGTFAHVTVKILEKEYNVACPLEEKPALLASAEFLNLKMREIRDSGKVVGLDRIAVMVALNLANEYLRLKNRESKLEGDASVRVKNLRERVENQLAKSQQLEF